MLCFLRTFETNHIIAEITPLETPGIIEKIILPLKSFITIKATRLLYKTNSYTSLGQLTKRFNFYYV